MSTLSVDTIQGQTTAANVKLPAGSILQIQRAQIGGNITTTSSTPVASGLQKAITPKFATSLIKVQCLGGRSYITAGQQLDISLFKDGSNVNSVGAGRWESHYSAGDHHHGGYSAVYFETAGTTSYRTYQVYFDIGSGTGYSNNSPAGNQEYQVHLVITEISV